MRGYRRAPEVENFYQKRAARFGELYESGATLEEIAATTEPRLTRERVRQILRKYGYPSLGYRGRPFLPTENEEGAIKAYQDCVKIDTITETYGVSRSRLQQLRKHYGVNARKWRSERTKERDLAVAHDYYHRPELTLTEIAKMHGLTHPGAPCQILRALGYPRNRKPANWKRRGSIDKQAILRDVLETAMSNNELMAKHDCSSLPIWQVLHDAGLIRVRAKLIREGKWPQKVE